MNIEERIRSQIEAILTNDAKNHAEMQEMASDDEPLETDSFAEERNLYQRIINNYRNAVGEVNHLLEENVGFLSAFYRIIESIKDRSDFQEICSRIVDCVLQDFGAEYCSIIFLEHLEQKADSFRLEGVREERKFLRVYSNASLLGSAEFEQVVAGMAAESSQCLNIEDVYKDSRFHHVDFPGVVRSLVCLPLILSGKPLGALILSHSLPHFFSDNHVRVLRILASIVAHLKLVTGTRILVPTAPPPKEPALDAAEDSDIFSIVLLDFEMVHPLRRYVPLRRESIKGIRNWLLRFLGPRESILHNGDSKLILLLPGVAADQLPARVAALSEAFQLWRADQDERLQGIRLNLGFSTCEEGHDLSRTLEIASMVMHPETDEGLRLAVEM